jgi:predicted nucleic acid-binding Zn ribbon protein
MKDEKLKECPKCGGNLKRLISAGSAPIFKGSGFYQTDYKNSSKELKKEPIEKVKTTEKTSESNTKTKSSSIDK